MNAESSPPSGNHLGAEKSPYLLQHKDNPVNWYAWGQEAFTAAQRQGKPIFLSIGYSTCYWCHVMEKDSFETEEIAEILNRSFISVKVDREEHPDVDKIYMDAVVAMTGQGGWPMSVFLTSDRKPFFGGTFFPRQQFAQILTRIDTLWREDRSNVTDVASKLTAFLARYDEDGLGGVADTTLLRDAYKQLSSAFDETYSGFGPAPKFPRADAIQLLLRIHRRTGDPRALLMAEKTLQAMARGGLYDHLGGGFHRYSTDQRWLVPHFEKMLYDNALLAVAYLEAYRLTGNELYASVARETFDYVLREMTAPEGGFYSAQDAGEVKREGEYYVWSESELKAQLSEPAFKRFSVLYGVTAEGNFENHTTVLALQPEYSWEVKSEPLMKEAAMKLLKQRTLRAAPHKDDKVLTAWNGLMIHALAQGYLTLGEERYLDAAKRASSFVNEKLMQNGELLRRYRDGDARIPGYIDDYAFMIQALISLFEATGEEQYLLRGRQLQTVQDRLLWDDTVGAYFHSAASSDELIVRKKELNDGAMPAGNSVSALNLLRLYGLTFEDGYGERAKKLITTIASQAKRYPSAFAAGLCSLDWYTDDAKEVAVIGAESDEQRRRVREDLAKHFAPNKVVAMNVTNQKDSSVALLHNKPQLDNSVTYYVCSGHTCKAPTTDIKVLESELARSRSLTLN